MQLELFGYLLEIDRVATIEAYREDITTQCKCAYCENFRATFNLLPKSFLNALAELGADPSKPSNSITYYENPDGTHFYEAWYHVIGKITRVKTKGHDKWGNMLLEDGSTVNITTRNDLVPENFPEAVIQVTIHSNLPWVIAPLEENT